MSVPLLLDDDDASAGEALTPLLALLQAADPDAEARAWAAFLLAYTPLLLGVARSLGGEYDTAMDRYAFMLERLRRDGYARLRRYSPQPGVSFAGWLRVVARRLCLDLHRHERGRPRPLRYPGAHTYARVMRGRLQSLRGVPLEVAEGLQVTEGGDPAGLLDHAEAVGRLRSACERLVPADQELLRLRFEEGLPALAIAERIGAPSQFHVYRRLRRVLSDLRGEVAPGSDGWTADGSRNSGTAVRSGM